ncbi:hypothetical protein PG988_000308 [Apiospora saccharicola]
MEDDKRANVTVSTARAAIEKAIRGTGDQKNWQCRAMTMDPRKLQRIKIVCRDQTEHRPVKQVAEKTNESGARVLRDALYPIKVDSVRRTAVLDENNNIRDGAAEAFGQENETTVAKVVCKKLRTAIEVVRRRTETSKELVFTGNFNRHDQRWGGEEVRLERQGEADPIIHLMAEFGLSILLSRGAKTWSGGTHSTTVDLVLVSEKTKDSLANCRVLDTDHGI